MLLMGRLAQSFHLLTTGEWNIGMKVILEFSLLKVNALLVFGIPM